MIRKDLLKSLDFERFHGVQKKIEKKSKKSCIFLLTFDSGHGILYEV